MTQPGDSRASLSTDGINTIDVARSLSADGHLLATSSYDGDVATVNEYTWDPGTWELLATATDDNTSIVDHVTRSTVATEEFETLPTSWSGDIGPAAGPYGSSVPTTTGQGYREELQTGDGLVHLRNRDYDPSTGAFITRDPLDGVKGTTTVTNPFAYAGNDPMNRADPLGLRPQDSDFDLAQDDNRALPADLPDATGDQSEAGVNFPFEMFNTWHTAVQLDLAARVGISNARFLEPDRRVDSPAERTSARTQRSGR